MAEDESKLASSVEKGFRGEGYELDVAYDGQMGLSLCRQNEYDLIILDVKLPHYNGFELCRLIRLENPDMPVLFLTALDSLDEKVRGFKAGAADDLAKPFKFQELLRARALTKRQAGRYVWPIWT
ncbi:response regulator transcription factor [Hymenobacter lapidiphilus]|uniref:response regulator transcription factor n=1 Tax=Hymenobacter lapidiphilus TaxID=2608003 RepID=UPI00293BB2A9|nr:response regulator [Hymenobacter lapidiphilus]